ncbi:uncharacterized protein LOC131059841 isoform X2 [Cryptomeria japonica]|uniref:uncharacterized protein LOC131059841 isoform X2 n=1 Tax=Cryptomeria japonica TaxID=3369 RepID=UPI0025AD0893|nr:uncharacterized protein LOC131059841 isoform X2 [Cryptomeria japonica]
MLQPSTLRICMQSRPIAAAAERQKSRKSHDKLNHNSGSQKSLVLHAFADLSRVSPLVFVHILQNTYVPRNGKAIVKFQALRQQVIHALPSAPPPGPATYVVSCLNALLVLDADSNEALSHLLTSALSSLDKVNMSIADSAEARILASKLFQNVITGSVTLRVRVLVKLATVFGIRLRDIREVVHTPELDEAEKNMKVTTCIEKYILGLIKLRLYTSAVALLKQFSLQHSSSHDFLLAMIHDNQFEAAEEWAAYMGKYMICSLIRHLTEMGMFKKAYKNVEKYNLLQEFPGAYHQYRKSTLRKLIEKECWDVAEAIATEDCILVQYMVSLAQEVGNEEKAADLCDRHGLAYIPLSSAQGRAIKTQYLQVLDYVSEENVIWVDTADGLANAKQHFSTIKIAGIDCEWRPNLLKEEKMNKVSIMQIGTGKKVYIIDLIKLHVEKPDELDNCLRYIFHSSNILKLGYALHNDLGQLLHSYKDMACFHYCEPILDLQALGGHSKGGLSGLAKTALGGYLNKALRMTDWEKRPLSPNQLHYAALDAAVLIPIFNFVSCQQFALGEGSEVLADWKSHVKCFKSNFSHKKNPANQEEKDQSVSSEAIQMDAKTESNAVDAFGPEASMRASCNMDVSCILEEELVYTSCNLLGLPMPGLLKSELQNYAQSKLLPLPTYNVSQIIGPANKLLYFCTLRVGSMEFCGRLSSSKREAEISAAIDAISHLFKGEDCGEGNI